MENNTTMGNFPPDSRRTSAHRSDLYGACICCQRTNKPARTPRRDLKTARIPPISSCSSGPTARGRHHFASRAGSFAPSSTSASRRPLDWLSKAPKTPRGTSGRTSTTPSGAKLSASSLGYVRSPSSMAAARIGRGQSQRRGQTGRRRNGGAAHTTARSITWTRGQGQRKPSVMRSAPSGCLSGSAHTRRRRRSKCTSSLRARSTRP